MSLVGTEVAGGMSVVGRVVAERMSVVGSVVAGGMSVVGTFRNRNMTSHLHSPFVLYHPHTHL